MGTANLHKQIFLVREIKDRIKTGRGGGVRFGFYTSFFFADHAILSENMHTHLEQNNFR